MTIRVKLFSAGIVLNLFAVVLSGCATKNRTTSTSESSSPYDSRSISVPIPDIFYAPQKDRICITINGPEALVHGKFYVPKGTRLRDLVSLRDSNKSPLRADKRLFTQALLLRGNKTHLRLIPDTLHGPDAVLEEGDIIQAWSNCMGF